MSASKNPATTTLISPYKGKLVNLLVSPKRATELTALSAGLQSITLTPRELCDLEMLAIGAFSPLRTFMDEADFHGVIQKMRLADGTLFPIPITLAVPARYPKGTQLALRDRYGNLLAVLTVSNTYTWDEAALAKAVIGSTDRAHNFVREIATWPRFFISGPLEVIAVPAHKDFPDLRLTPSATRMRLAAIGNPDVVAFQTRNPLHRAHEEMTKRAARLTKATLLIHPAVGLTKPGDIDHITRVRCYQVLVDNYYADVTAMLSLMPLAMRMAGPREALWHAVIRRNYGANHFIVGRDHAGPGNNSDGDPFYGAYEALQLAQEYAADVGINIIAGGNLTYLPDEERYEDINHIEPKTKTATISGTQVRTEYLAKGRQLPEWFTRPEVAAILSEVYTPTVKQGFCVWFTGLSGSGKSTIAQALESDILQRGRRTTVLDGDVVRQNLSKGLGFSREDRAINVMRVGYVASEIVKHHGIVLCALISPHEDVRQRVQALFEPDNFIQVYVSTPLQVCQDRDPKGNYAKVSHGQLSQFTGISDEYEPPNNPAVVIDTTTSSVDDCVLAVITELKRRGFIAKLLKFGA